MARPIVWPQVPAAAQGAAGAPEPAADPGRALDQAAIAAALGPELARLMGLRISARPDPSDKPVGQALALGRVRLAAKAPIGPVAIDIAVEGDGAAFLLERLFGARATEAAAARAADLSLLPPGSASWLALCRTVATAAARALEAGGHAPGGAPILPVRALTADPAPGAIFLLDIDGAPARLLLAPEIPALPPPPPPAAPDLARFRQQVRARAFEVELPVSLRIAETRMPVSEVAALIEGDILPLARPETLDVMAAGRRIARFPASAFRPEAPEPGSEEPQ